MQFRTANYIVLHYEHTERGKPLIAWVNSLGTDFRIWDRIVASFLSDFSVLRYDKRGHGLSDVANPPYSIDDHVDDLAGLINHLGADQVIICGLSVGGLIAQGLCARRPELVRALILSDTAHKIGTAESWNSRIDTVRTDGIEAIADDVLEKWFTPAFHATEREMLAGCRNMLVRQSVEGYAGTCAALRDADHTEIVKRIKVPTLCVVGDQDGSTPPDLVRSMADLIPGAQFEVIPGAGHIPCIERPAELVARIRHFLAQNPAGVNRHA